MALGSARRAGACATMLLALLAPVRSDAAASTEGYVRWTRRDVSKIKKIRRMVKAIGGTFTVRSEFYDVATEVDEDFTAQTAHYMDKLYSTFLKLFKFPVVLQVRPKVMIFGGQEAYQDALGSDTQSRGYFCPRWSKDGQAEFALYSYIKSPSERSFADFYVPVLNHEGTHQIVQMQAGRNRVPIFLNEGLATYFQFMKLHENSEAMRDARSGFLRITAQAYRAEKLPSLSSLINISGPWDVDEFGPQTTLRYGCAESFVAFLITDKKGRRYLSKVYRAAISGKPVDGLLARDLPLLERSWHSFLASVP